MLIDAQYNKKVSDAELDPRRTVVLRLHQGELVCDPLSAEAATRLMLAAGGPTSTDLEFDLEELLNHNVSFVDEDVPEEIKYLEWSGLQFVLEGGSLKEYFRSYRRRMRLMVPFNFETPEAYVEINRRNEYVAKGPFVEEVFSDEYRMYRNRISDLGLDDPSREFHLFGYQADDIAKAACKRRVFLSHEMGLGKTSIAAAVPIVVGVKRVLVVCPGAAIGSWTSGWRHELFRLGVPKGNIRVVDTYLDLPRKSKPEAPSDYPYFYLVPYTKIGRASWTRSKRDCFITGCPACLDAVDMDRAAGNLSENEASREADAIRAEWTGNYCPRCEYRWAERVARRKDGKDRVPIYKAIRPWMFNTGIFDESHYIKAGNSQRSRSILALPPFKRTIIMTGTMLSNGIKDAYTQVLRLFPNGEFPIGGKMVSMCSSLKHKASSRRFTDMFVLSGSLSSDIPTLRNTEDYWGLQSTIQIRRRANDPDVNRAIELPPVQHHVELIEMDRFHKHLWGLRSGRAREELLKNHQGDRSQVEEIANQLSEFEIKNFLTGLRRVAACPDEDPLYEEMKKADEDETEFISTKDVRLLELAREAVDAGDKLVVFTTWKSQTERLKAVFKKHDVPFLAVDSSKSVQQKWALIDRHRNEPGTGVFLASIQSMSEAVNLTPATDSFKVRTVVFLNPDWSLQRMTQAWKRVHRIGQSEPVNVHYLYHQDCIEATMNRTLHARMKNIHLLTDRTEMDDSNYEQVDVSMEDLLKEYLLHEGAETAEDEEAAS